MAETEKHTQHIFIIGAKSLGQYGGYETFVDKLTEQHQNEPSLQYHIACKAAGYGSADGPGLYRLPIVLDLQMAL